VVVRDGVQEYEVNGRAAAMVRYIAKRATSINRVGPVKVELNAAGRKVKGRVVAFDDGEEIIQ